MRHTFSLQKRLLTRTLIGVLAVWLLTAAAVWLEAQHEVDELLDAHLAQSAALLIVQQNTSPDDDEEAQDAPTLHKYAHRVAYQVFHEGHLVMHSPNVMHTPMASHREGFDTLTLPDGKAWRVFAAKGGSADVQVYVAEQIESRDDIVTAVVRGFLMPLSAALPLLLLGLWWNVRRGLQPLQQLRQVLLQRNTQTLDPVELPETPDELQPMLDALNDLLARLAKQLESERRFTSDAAHELRTPIAAIRVQAQVALGTSADDPTRQQALKDTLAGCDRATRVVEQLLTLARIEKPQDLALAPFRIDQLAQEVAGEWVPDALRRHQTLELHAPQALTLTSQSTLWQILLRNLLDNALRYSPEGATVRVDVLPGEGGCVVLTVQDSGPGMTAQDRARLGERFFRGSDNTATGSGLGWSIVRRIAALLGITLQVEPSDTLGGLRVTLVTNPYNTLLY